MTTDGCVVFRTTPAITPATRAILVEHQNAQARRWIYGEPASPPRWLVGDWWTGPGDGWLGCYRVAGLRAGDPVIGLGPGGWRCAAGGPYPTLFELIARHPEAGE